MEYSRGRLAEGDVEPNLELDLGALGTWMWAKRARMVASTKRSRRFVTLEEKLTVRSPRPAATCASKKLRKGPFGLEKQIDWAIAQAALAAAGIALG